MATVLLIVIYIAFIGLGLPDSLFGAAWPSIYSEFHLPIAYGSLVTVTVCCGTIISSISSGRVISRFGTGRVAAVSTAMTAAALLGYSCSGSLWMLCLCAVPLGLGAGSIDTALNNYVALHYSASQMSFLHCFYGIGVTISPYILSLVIAGPSGWRGGYRIACFIQMLIAVILFAALPLWSRVRHGDSTAEDAPAQALTLRQALSIPGVKLMCLLFICSCAVECSCGGWGSTYLVEYKHMAPAQAARLLTFYYVGMTLGRFLSGVLARRLDPWKIIYIGLSVLGSALALLLLPLPSLISAVGLFMIGLGNGPMYPNFNYLTPRNFGPERSQSIIGTQMAASYVGILAAPALCGVLGQAFGMVIFPGYMLIYYLLMLYGIRRVRRVLGK